jgi:hypothetical protein
MNDLQFTKAKSEAHFSLDRYSRGRAVRAEAKRVFARARRRYNRAHIALGMEEQDEIERERDEERARVLEIRWEIGDRRDQRIWDLQCDYRLTREELSALIALEHESADRELALLP